MEAVHDLQRTHFAAGCATLHGTLLCLFSGELGKQMSLNVSAEYCIRVLAFVQVKVLDSKDESVPMQRQQLLI